MAGFKRTIQEFGPAGFWTFDGEPFNLTTRLFEHSPLTIFDESETLNDGILMVGSDEPSKAYRAGMGSQVPLEPGGQNCLCFGFYGAVNGLFPKAFVQVPDNPAYDTGDENGSFTVVFVFKKPSDEATTRAFNYPSFATSTFTKTLFTKGGLFTFTITDPWSGGDYITAAFPNGSMIVNTSTLSNFYGDEHLVIARWKVDPSATGPEAFVGTATLIVDGVVYGETKTTYAVSPPTTYFANNIEIGGTSSNSPVMDDRATTAIYMDQIALFTRGLEDVECYRLVKKMWEYETMVVRKGPSIYVPFSDDPVVNTTDTYQRVGSAQCYHTGQVVRNRPGPSNIPGSRAFLFARAIQVIKTTPSGYPAYPVALNADNYAFEMFLKTATTERAVVLSCQGVEKPYLGPLLQLNVGETGGYQGGALTFSENELGAVSTPIGEYANDGAFRHVVIQRRAAEWLEIIVDGELKASKKVGKAGLNALPGIITLMGSMPGQLYCDGELAHFAVYSGKVFTEAEAMARAQYMKIYRVRGNVTLRGTPYRATVRLYHYRTGELVAAGESLAEDGSYDFYLKNNAPVSVMVMSTADTNVRVRGFGPIIPAELPDASTG